LSLCIASQYGAYCSDLPEHIDDVAVHLRYVRRNRDLLLGKVTLDIMETELGTTSQIWHPVILTARDGLSVERVGELDLKFKLEELVILMSNDYADIGRVVHTKFCPNSSYFSTLRMG
jgi:hypothetical protein